jgi:hypothetical protein
MDKLKVFISWSGERSKHVAAKLDTWLREVIQAVEPKFSPNIEKGTFWVSEIRESLTTDFGIVCLTPETLNENWILFEAGALGKNKAGRVWTLLLCGLEHSAVVPPLSLIQHTKSEEWYFFRLLYCLNSACENGRVEPDVLKRIYNKNWPELQIAFEEAKAMSIDEPKAPRRSADDMALEVLQNTRDTLSMVRALTPGGDLQNQISELYGMVEEKQDKMSDWEIFEAGERGKGDAWDHRRK